MLLVRADAGPQIGSGHFMRCLALAQAWQEQGGTAIFLMAPGAETLGNRLKHDNIREVRLSSQPGSLADAKETSETAHSPPSGLGCFGRIPVFVRTISAL